MGVVPGGPCIRLRISVRSLGECTGIGRRRQLRDTRVIPAHRAGRVLRHRNLPQPRAPGIEHRQAPHQRLPAADHQFERLGGLHRPDDPGEHPQHPGLRAGGHRTRGRWRRVQAPVARTPLGVEDPHLPVEAQHRPVHQRQPQHDGRVIDQVPSGEVVGAVDDHVPPVQQTQGVLRGQPSPVGDDLDVGVERPDRRGCRVHLGAAHGGTRMDDLALQVGHVDVVVVNEADRTHPGGRQVQGCRRPEPTGADEQDPGGPDALLADHPHLRHERVAVIALQLIVAQRPQTLVGDHRSAAPIAGAPVDGAHGVLLILIRPFSQHFGGAVLSPFGPQHAPAPP